MRLLRAEKLKPDRRELVFRHHRVGPLVLAAVLAAPTAALAALRGVQLEGPPWYVWLGLGPVLALAGLVWLLGLWTAVQVAWRACSPANWYARISGPAVYVNLRSYQNAHFPDDAPTVARIEFAEIAGARRVRERWTEAGSNGESDTACTRRWIEFELRGADTAALAAAALHERERPGPEGRLLGVRGSTRYQHVTVLVTESGRVRLLDLGRGLRRALGERVRFAADRELDLDRAGGGGLDERLRALIARGNTLAATRLVHSEMKVPLGEAKRFVDELRRAA